jgi:serine/threonine protein kinase/Tfp pilus assembly protein PilF
MIEPARLAVSPQPERRAHWLGDPQILEGRERVARTRAMATGEHAYGEFGRTDDFVAEHGLPEVPGYELFARLGRGGMGIVYLARQVSLKRLVALKMIQNANPTSLARFRIEAEAVARLTHPNIVQIHQVGEHEGRPFLSLEYVEGETLEDRLAQGPMPDQAAAELVETLARAMHHAHERGILHRDLKPANVLLGQNRAESNRTDGTDKSHRSHPSLPSDSMVPKITDFGLAKILDVSTGPTRADVVVGTPSYMSPEQACSSGTTIGVTADVYSLGAILYECLTGRAPFVGKTLLQTLEQVRSQDAVPPRRLRANVSRDLETICLKCLEKAPEKRYASSKELADDLRSFLDNQPIRARPAPTWKRVTRAIRRRPVFFARSVGIAALVCLLITAWWLLQVSGQLLAQRNSERHRKFIQLRNEALSLGLLTSAQGALFTRDEAAARWDSAEKAAQQALTLAEPRVHTSGVALHPAFAAARKEAVVEDCYTLILLLATGMARRTVEGSRDREPANGTTAVTSVRPESATARLQKALRLLDRASQLGIETRAYHLRRADILRQLGRQGDADEHLERAQAVQAKGMLDHFLEGEERCRQGAWAQASHSFKQALAKEPSHFWAQFFQAICQLKLQHWEEARAGLTSCLAQQPDFVWAYLFRSFANEELHALSEADCDFTRALQLNPSVDAKYVLFLMRGVRHFSNKALDQAAADFRAAIKLKPEQYNAYLNLAHVFTAQKMFEQAERQFDEAMRQQAPTEVVVAYHVERGRQLAADGRYDEAVRAADAALAVDRDRPEPYDVRGLALLRLERFSEAERSFDQYLRRGGRPVADIFRARGHARMKLGRFPDAVEDYSRVLERSPDAEIYQHRGWAHFFADAWKLALRDFESAIELAPLLSDAYTGRGLALVMLGRYREAVQDADVALRLQPGGPAMMLNIACIFSQAIARVSDDAEINNKRELVDRYRKRAIEAIRKTLGMLPVDARRSFWEDKILPDAALGPIRKDGLSEVQQEFFPTLGS